MVTKMKRKPKTGLRTVRDVKRKPKSSSKVSMFRWLKKSMLGKSHAQSMDLLDRWILKKNPLGLFL